jgi:hypothetical protein
LKLLEENIGKMLEHIRTDTTFLNGIPIAQEIRARIDKWDCIRLKSFFTTKETIIQVKL